MSNDISNIPLSSLRGPPHRPQQLEATSPDEVPEHHIRPHGYLNDQYYEEDYRLTYPSRQDHHQVASAADAYSPSASRNTTQKSSKHIHYNSNEKKAEGNGSRDYDKDEAEELQAPRPLFTEPRSGGHSRSASVASSADDETDDFDWNTSDEEEDQDADGQDVQSGTRKIRAKRGRKVYLFCMRLARPVRIFVLGLFLTLVALVPLFVVLFGIDSGNSARYHVMSWSIWVAIIFASTAGTFIALDFLPPIILRLAMAIYGRTPEVFKTYLEVAMSTIFYVKLVLCVAWAWISLGGILAAIWKGSAGARPDYWTWIFRIIRALFATAVILFAEKLAIHIVGVNFHKAAIKDRLTENQKALKYLDKLHESKYLTGSGDRSKRVSGNWGARFGLASQPPSPGPNSMLAGGRKTPGAGAGSAAAGQAGYFPDATTSPVNNAEKSSPAGRPGFAMHDNPSTTSTERLRNVKADRKANFAVQLQDALATATLKDSRLYKSRGFGSQQSARKLAKKLFNNLGHHRKTLVAEDFIPYFKTEAEAREAFAIFDKDKNGDIDKGEMREAVQRIYRERRALTTSLKDMNSALQKLDAVFLFLGLIITVFIWLLIFNPTSTVSNLVPVSTVVVAFSFVFGNSAKNIFESMIFIFATHPYDVGDLVCIDDTWMFVKEFGLLSTVFNTTTNQIVVAPNSLLASSKYIHNARRSGNMWETTLIQFGFEMGLQKIDEFRSKLRAWVKENDRDWAGGLDVNYNTITNMNAVEMIIAMEHKGNWMDWGGRWTKRTKLMRQVKVIADELDLSYSLPVQPVTQHPRAGPGPRSTGRNIAPGRSGGPAGRTAAHPGAGGQAGQSSSFAGLPSVGGVGQGFGLNVPKTTTT